jgi:hypothetical protein
VGHRRNEPDSTSHRRNENKRMRNVGSNQVVADIHRQEQKETKPLCDHSENGFLAKLLFVLLFVVRALSSKTALLHTIHVHHVHQHGCTTMHVVKMFHVSC